MKIFWLKFITITFLLSFQALLLNAQRSNGLAVEGKISVEEGSPEGAIIQMYQDGRRLDNYGVGADGNYKVELNYNHKFELIFERENNFSQKIVVETAVPANVLRSDPKFPPFPVNINLFTEIPGIDKSFSQKTVLKIYYNPNVDNFISELYYNDAQIKKLIDQAIIQSKMIGKEADYLSKLTRAEIAELRKEYNQLLEQAGKQYGDEQFLAALDGFKAASKIFPNEQFPKDRISEINDLLGLIMAASELDKALAERFTALIKEADLLFNEKKYADAKNSYNRALSIKPTHSYSLQQVKLINKLLNEQLTDKQYRELIAQADNSFREILYNEAINKYKDALQLKPNETYPKNKIDEINGILADQANSLQKQKSYDQAMFQAESLFEKQFYEKSLASYRNALVYKPNDEAATNRIDEIRAIMKEIAERIQYDKFVKSADKSYKKKLYPEALNDYKEAFALFPDEPHPKSRIEEINRILDLKESFADLVYKADNQFISENYKASKSLYQQALEIRGTDKHALDRVREIDRILALQDMDTQYSSLIAEADQLFQESSYENSKNRYTEALRVKPKEKYPKNRITEINSILQQIAKTNQRYLQAIAKADGLFQQKSYEKAKLAFGEAGSIKPEETYPPEMIAKIDGLLTEQARILAEQQAAEQARLKAEAEAEKTRQAEAAAAEAARLAAIRAEKDKNYSDAVAKADNLFDAKDYSNSRSEYRKALTIKPDETYPQQRIDEIGNLLAQLSAAQKAYEEAVSRGDKEFRKEGFEAAKTAYNEASTAKPEETYPGEMIAKIDSIVVNRARLAKEAAAAEAARLAAIRAEKDKNYSDAVAKADNLFDAKDYANSRSEYRKALTIKPDETYPQQRIDEIEKELAALALAKKEQELLNKNYLNLIQQADRFFTSSNFLQSKSKYESALELKPEEAHPKERIVEIDNILQQQKLDEEYRAIVVIADGFFKTESYLQAKTEYNKALAIKPEEQYPENQIKKIEDILAKEQQRILAEKAAADDLERRKQEIALANSEIDARNVESEAELTGLYNQFIQKADALFTSKQYNLSRAWYYQALNVKANEPYPLKQIAEINKLVGSLLLNQRDRDYQGFIDLADSTFRNNDLAVARGWYNRALSVKANEVYPKNQIIEIQAKIAERMAGQAGQQFDENKVKAEKAFETKNYNVARFWYKKALELRPNDKDVKARLTEIEKLLK